MSNVKTRAAGKASGDARQNYNSNLKTELRRFKI